jgi:hypothetical protein
MIANRLPCPVCNGTADLVRLTDTEKHRFAVECEHGCLWGPIKMTKRAATEAWNIYVRARIARTKFKEAQS